MKTYEVIVYEKVAHIVTLDAENAVEAREKAKTVYLECDHYGRSDWPEGVWEYYVESMGYREQLDKIEIEELK